LRICEKCGKANDVTRKYCTRCGASLFKSADSPTPKPSIPIPEAGRVVTGADIERANDTEQVSTSQPSMVSEEERGVRPSEVSPDRMRTADRHVEKTEYEKAQEAFEASGTAEPEERMLRASELREYEDEIDTDSKARPASEEQGTDTLGEVASPEPVEGDEEEGREVVKQILERVKAAEARAHSEEISSPPERDLEAPEQELPIEPAEPLSPEILPPEVEVESLDDTVTAPPEDTPVEVRPSLSPTTTMTMPGDEHARDEKLRTIESDIKAFKIEHQQLTTELHKLQTRLDEEVERYRTVAETKRARAEGIERELRLAKKEYDDASKEHKNAENRRKKELSDAEKRINDVEKRTKKAEDAKQKRIQDLEKERQKREEEARSS
jgi:hypothetical protein